MINLIWIKKMKKFLKENLSRIIFFVFLTLFIIIFFTLKLNRYLTYENADMVKEFILNFSILGPIIIIILFIIFNLAVFPTFYFIFIAGFLYGPVYGFIIGWIGMIIGLSISFFNARYLFRKKFIEKYSSKKIIQTLEEYIKKYHGWSVLFLRFFFIIPYNVQNVSYGLTSIKSYVYIIFSSIGILPITILYIWLGYLLSENKIGINNIKNILIIIIVFITIFAIIFFNRMLLKKRINTNKN